MSLTEAIFWTKIGLKVGGVVLVIFFGAYFIYAIIAGGTGIPTKYLEPNNKCGTLPTVNIKELSYVDTSKSQIKIETDAAALPDLPKIVNVYEYDVKGQNYTSLEKAQALAESFTFDPTKFSKPDSSTYQWQDLFTSRTLTIESSNLNFELYKEPATISTYNPGLPSLQRAGTLASNYLSQLSLIGTEYDKIDPVTFMIKFDGNTMHEAESLNEAALVRVDFRRQTVLMQIEAKYYKTREVGIDTRTLLKDITVKEVDDPTTGEKIRVKELTTEIVTDFPLGGNIQVYISAAKQTTADEPLITYPIVSYVNWPIKADPCGTYLIKQPSEAIQEIADGNGKLVFLAKKNGDRLNPTSLPGVDTFNVFDIQIVYLDTAKKQKFLQPIYMVSGEAIFSTGEKGKFTFYIPAIKY